MLSTACIDALHSAFNEGGKFTTAEQGLRESVLEAVVHAIGEAGVDGGFQRYDAVCKIIPQKLPVAPPLNRLHARGESGPRPGRRAAPSCGRRRARARA